MDTAVKIPVIQKFVCQLTGSLKIGTTMYCHTRSERTNPEAVLMEDSTNDSSCVCLT